MSVHTRVSGIWREVEAPSVRVSGTWRSVDEQFVRVEGIWRTVFEEAFDPSQSIGTFTDGGYYGGTITDCDGEDWAIIVSPEASGAPDSIKDWKTTQTTTSGTDSLCDGLGNTTSICADGGTHPAGDWVCSLNDGGGINGYTDWYLPSVDELEILYQNMYQADRNETLPVGTDWRDDGEGFQEDPAYWSSSQYSATDSWFMRFSYNVKYNHIKTYSLRVRAVRRVLL